MDVQCVICETIEQIDENSAQAKKLVNRRISSYLCKECDERIAKKTKERHKTGKFQLYNSNKKN